MFNPEESEKRTALAVLMGRGFVNVSLTYDANRKQEMQWKCELHDAFLTAPNNDSSYGRSPMGAVINVLGRRPLPASIAKAHPGPHLVPTKMG